MVSPSYGTVNGRTEQNQLNNTLHKLVAKVIDVSSIDNNIEQSDWNERQRIYSQRINSIKRPLTLKSKYLAAINAAHTGLSSGFVSHCSKADPLSTAPLINRSLTFEPISEEDLNLINSLSERASNAVHTGFKVHCEESFVVQFDP